MSHIMKTFILEILWYSFRLSIVLFFLCLLIASLELVMWIFYELVEIAKSI